MTGGGEFRERVADWIERLHDQTTEFFTVLLRRPVSGRSVGATGRGRRSQPGPVRGQHIRKQASIVRSWAELSSRNWPNGLAPALAAWSRRAFLSLA